MSRRLKQDIKDVASMMGLYLEKFGVEKKMDCEAFAAALFEGIEEKVCSGVRLPLPLNLGYIQGLQHTYRGKDKEHLMKFGNLDFSVIWMKHPLFRYHSIKTKPELNDRLKAAKHAGKPVLKDYVTGDFFIV